MKAGRLLALLLVIPGLILAVVYKSKIDSAIATFNTACKSEQRREAPCKDGGWQVWPNGRKSRVHIWQSSSNQCHGAELNSARGQRERITLSLPAVSE
jgi:hypothetical protein|eukprot:6455531-Prymnesium_polylepis.1